MKKIIATLVLALIANIGMAQITAINVDTPFIDVVGTAYVDADPDMIFIKVIIDESEVSKSVDEHETRLVDALANTGIDVDEQLRVKDMNNTVYQYWLKKNKNITRKEYEILAHSAEEVTSIFSAIKEADINNADIDRMELSNQIELEQQVEIKAIKNAKNKAVELANSIDQEIGNAIIILDKNSSEGVGNYGRRNLTASVSVGYAMRVRAKSMEQFSIELKKIRIETTVSVRFHLN